MKPTTTTMTMPLLALALAVASAGCGSKGDDTTAEARAELAALPSLEDAKAALRDAVGLIAAAAQAALPGAQWKDGGNEATLSCNAPYSDLGGSMYYSPNRVAVAAPVTAEQWAQIESSARGAAAGIGATEVEVRSDLPANREVWFRGPAGLVVELAHQGNLSIAATTGCRLPADEKAP